MLTQSAIEGYKQYTERTIGKAKYQMGGQWYETDFSRRERMANGKIAVYISIKPQSASAVKISRVQIYDTAGILWADKSENITIEGVQEGLLYRFTFDLHEEEA